MTRPIVTAPTTALLLTSDATSGEIGPAPLPGPAPLTPSLTLHCRDRVSRKRQAAAPPNAVGCVGGPEAAAAVLAERYLADAADGAHSTAPRATLVTVADVGDGAAASLLFGTDQGPGLLATVAAGLLSGTAAPGTVLLSVTAVPPHAIRSKVPHGTDLLNDGAAAASPLHEVDGALASSAVPVPLADLPSLTAALSKVRRRMATGSAAHCVATLRSPGQGSGSGLTFVAMAPLSTDQAALRDYAAVAHRSLEAHGEALRQRRHDVADSTASTRNKSHGQDTAPAPQTVLSRLLPPVAPTLTALCCPADAVSAGSPHHAAFASVAALTLSPALGAPVPPVPVEAAAALGPPQGPNSLCAQRSEARSGQAAARRESLTAFKALAVAEAAGRATLHAAEDQRRVLIAAKCAHRPSALHAPLVERRVAKTKAAARLTTLTAIGTSTADSATVLAPASVTVDVKGEAHVAKPKRRKDNRAAPPEEPGSGDASTDPDAGAPEGGGDGEDLVRLESIPDFGGPLQLRPSLIAAHGPASVDGVHVVVSPMTETRDSTLAGVLRERRRRSSTDDVAAALALSVLSESAPMGALSRSCVGAAGHQGQDNHLTAEGPKAAGSAASTPRAPATVGRVPSLPKLPVSATATPRVTPNATPRATPGTTPRELPVPKGSARRAPEKATPLPRVASLRNSLAVRAEAQQLLDATPDLKPRGRGKRMGASHLAPIPDRRRASAPAPLSRPVRPTPSPAGRPGLAPLTARGQGTGGPQRTASSPAMAHTRVVHRHIGRRADSSSSDGVSPSGERRQRNTSKHKSASPVKEELWPGTADDDEDEPPARRPVPAPPSRNRSTQPSPRPSPSASLAEPPALHGAPLGFVPVGTPSTGPEEDGMDPPPGAALDPSLRASDTPTPTSPLPPGVPYGGLVSEADAAATLEGLRRRTDEQGLPPNAVAFEAAETWSTATGPGTGTTTPLLATPAQVTAQPPTTGQPTARAPSEPEPPLPPTAALAEIRTSPPRGLTLDVFHSPELGEHVDSESTTRSSSPVPAETEARAVEDPSRRRSSVSSAGSFTGPGSRRGSAHSLSNGVSFTTPLDRIQQARQRAEARADRRRELQRQLSRSSSAASMSRESTPGTEAPLSGQPLQSDTSGDTTQTPGPSVPWYLRQQSAQPPAAETAPEAAASYEPPTHKSPLRDVAKDRAPHVDMERTPRAAAVEAARRRRESLEAQSAAGPTSPELHPAPAPHTIPRMVVTPPPPPDTAADVRAVVASPRHEEPKAAPALPSAPTTSTSTPGRSRHSSFRSGRSSGRSSGTTSVEGRRGERVVRIVSPTDELPPRAPRRPGPTPPASPPPPREPIPPPLPAPHYGATNAAGAERKPNMNLFSRAAPGGSRDSTPLRPAASPSNEGRCAASDSAPVLGPYTVGAVAAASPCTLRTDCSARAQGEPKGPLTRAHFPMRPSALWLSKPPPAGT